MRLVADLGGTNVRFGLVAGDARPDRVERLRNDDFKSFPDALARYRANAGMPEVDEVAIAIAGPVTGDTARLTNRDWIIDAQRTSDDFGGARVKLMNDLNALGYSVPHLSGEDIALLTPETPAGATVQQALVIGIGTGFNVSPVLNTGHSVYCPVSEAGHSALPANISDKLKTDFPDMPPMITVEECFSGRGFAQLRETWERTSDYPTFLEYYAELVALLSRNLMLDFMPMSGVYFAGGVAREVMQSPAQSKFAQVFSQPFPLSDDLKAPAYLILDDSAALRGCAAAEI